MVNGAGWPRRQPRLSGGGIVGAGLSGGGVGRGCRAGVSGGAEGLRRAGTCDRNVPAARRWPRRGDHPVGPGPRAVVAALAAPGEVWPPAQATVSDRRIGPPYRTAVSDRRSAAACQPPCLAAVSGRRVWPPTPGRHAGSRSGAGRGAIQPSRAAASAAASRSTRTPACQRPPATSPLGSRRTPSPWNRPATKSPMNTAPLG